MVGDLSNKSVDGLLLVVGCVVRERVNGWKVQVVVGKPGGVSCMMARFLLESEAVGLMRYCPGSPGPVVTN